MSTTTTKIAATEVQAKTGDFVWHELRTTDAKGAEDFYTHVVGWKAKGSGDPGGMPYTLFSTGNQDAAGLMELTPSMCAGGASPEWVGFVGVDDVDAYAHKLEQAGGKLRRAPMDIPGIGRFAPVEDSQGAAFLLFKGSLDAAPPRPPEGTPGTVGWNELAANDGEAVWSFYSGLFGWKEDRVMDMGPMGGYRIFSNGGNSIGGMMTRDQSQSSKPTWLYYFNVGDIDAAVTRIQEKHGVILMGPHEVPGPMWIVIGNDPQGATFAVVGSRETAAKQ